MTVVGHAGREVIELGENGRAQGESHAGNGMEVEDGRGWDKEGTWH